MTWWILAGLRAGRCPLDYRTHLEQEQKVPEEGARMLILKGHTNSVQALVYTPDGRTLISAGDDRRIRLWDVQNGKEWGWLGDHTDAILSLSLHPSGKQLASGGHDKRVLLWEGFEDANTLETLEVFPRFDTTINAVAFSANGRFLAAGADRRAQ